MKNLKSEVVVVVSMLIVLLFTPFNVVTISISGASISFDMASLWVSGAAIYKNPSEIFTA